MKKKKLADVPFGEGGSLPNDKRGLAKLLKKAQELEIKDMINKLSEDLEISESTIQKARRVKEGRSRPRK